MPDGLIFINPVGGIGNDVADENFAMGCVSLCVGLPTELYPHIAIELYYTFFDL